MPTAATTVVTAIAAAAALVPATSSRTCVRSVLRRTRNPRFISATRPNPPPPPSPPSRRRSSLLFRPHPPSSCPCGWRALCSRTLAADLESVQNSGAESGEAVREFKKRLKIADVKGGPDEGMDRLGERLSVRGWVRTCRSQRSITFVEVNDGSCLSNMQCVMSSDAEGYDQVESGNVATGASVLIEGTLVSSKGSKQKVELEVAKLIVIGKSDPLTYPIQKKRTSREFLRTMAHLRPRTNTFGAVTRVRNALAYATHKFFQENGFVWISSPIITASDCEGAGEQFCVTTLIPNSRESTDCSITSIPTSKDGTIDWSNVHGRD